MLGAAKMKTTILFLLSFGMLNSIFAQPGKISGLVSGNGNGVIAATVSIKPLYISVITDSSGHFHFIDISFNFDFVF